mmetsp:Transcript_15418/g.32440  ORF Transcript_15418/g.32440 Transcript_15418/m.32440 type:complete len:874 (+) Transcript_15418:1365-3986(+)
MVNIQKSKRPIIHGSSTNQTIIRIEISLNESDPNPTGHHIDNLAHGCIQQRQCRPLGIFGFPIRPIGLVVVFPVTGMPKQLLQFLVLSRFHQRGSYLCLRLLRRGSPFHFHSLPILRRFRLDGGIIAIIIICALVHLPIPVLDLPHLHPPGKQIQMPDPNETRTDATGDRALLLDQCIRIGLGLRRQLTDDLSPLLLAILLQPRVVHRRQIRQSFPRPVGIPRSLRRVPIHAVGHDEGQGPGGADSEVVHGLGGEEFANGGAEDGASVGAAAEGSLAGALELEFPAGGEVGVEVLACAGGGVVAAEGVEAGSVIEVGGVIESVGGVEFVFVVGIVCSFVSVAAIQIHARGDRVPLPALRGEGNNDLSHADGPSIPVSVSGPVRTIGSIPLAHNAQGIRSSPRLDRHLLQIALLVDTISCVARLSRLKRPIHIPAKIPQECLALGLFGMKSQLLGHFRRMNDHLGVFQRSRSDRDVMPVEDGSAGVSHPSPIGSELGRGELVILGIFGGELLHPRMVEGSTEGLHGGTKERGNVVAAGVVIFFRSSFSVGRFDAVDGRRGGNHRQRRGTAAPPARAPIRGLVKDLAGHAPPPLRVAIASPLVVHGRGIPLDEERSAVGKQTGRIGPLHFRNHRSGRDQIAPARPAGQTANGALSLAPKFGAASALGAAVVAGAIAGRARGRRRRGGRGDEGGLGRRGGRPAREGNGPLAEPRDQVVVAEIGIQADLSVAPVVVAPAEVAAEDVGAAIAVEAGEALAAVAVRFEELGGRCRRGLRAGAVSSIECRAGEAVDVDVDVDAVVARDCPRCRRGGEAQGAQDGFAEEGEGAAFVHAGRGSRSGGRGRSGELRRAGAVDRADGSATSYDTVSALDTPSGT